MAVFAKTNLVTSLALAGLLPTSMGKLDELTLVG